MDTAQLTVHQGAVIACSNLSFPPRPILKAIFIERPGKSQGCVFLEIALKMEDLDGHEQLPSPQFQLRPRFFGIAVRDRRYS
ncbi:hypothetical protein [Undibacterium sp.]|jgi:hypothetical protein|uniref:hypothetical protein n=1 Tax=Undibacterium sp. TaxID=1914977 RepID=UPI002B7D5EA9|nr:hypothetical protein [Undibacterium sp.]HTD06642.1 hypothetical protein [Undibacterium sp.]